MTSSPPRLYIQGYTRYTMVGTKGRRPVGWSRSGGTGLSSDRRLQYDWVKWDSLLIANHNAAVNTFPIVVHAAHHTTKDYCILNRFANRKESGAYGMIGDCGEVVTM